MSHSETVSAKSQQRSGMMSSLLKRQVVKHLKKIKEAQLVIKSDSETQVLVIRQPI